MLEDKTALGRADVKELEQLVSDYPSFPTAHLLLAKKYQLEGNENYEKQLKRASFYAGDRSVLYNLIYREEAIEDIPDIHADKGSRKSQSTIRVEPDDKRGEPGSEKSETRKPGKLAIKATSKKPIKKLPKSESKRSEPLIEDPKVTKAPKRLSKEADSEPVAMETKPRSEKHEFSSWFSQLTPMRVETSATPSNLIKTKNQQSISSSSKPPVSNYKPADDITEKEILAVEEMAFNSLSLNTDAISETLAAIMVQQGKIDKAIAMYERLRFKFPKKSSYFGNLIEKLTKE
ncbi:MAG: hypothetical protein IH946_04315 [Bacteroidetes bacterium]|nr:hypothetical protein [Bacteroidota bacterium]